MKTPKRGGSRVAFDGQAGGAGTVDRHVVGQGRQGASQGDRAGQAGAEVDGVAGRGTGIGRGDRGPERAAAGIGQRVDRERHAGQDGAQLEAFEAETPDGAAPGRMSAAARIQP
jgi:hypothetical protein